jgi:hypothetical protein
LGQLLGGCILKKQNPLSTAQIAIRMAMFFGRIICGCIVSDSLEYFSVKFSFLMKNNPH